MADVGNNAPVPQGFRRVILAVNVPESIGKDDMATEVSCTWDGTDVTVWDTSEDFVRDWMDVVVPED